MSLANTAPFASVSDAVSAAVSIQQIVDVHQEWFVSENGAAPFEIRQNEFEFYSSHGRLILAAWTATGASNWRITNWQWNREKLSLQATRRMGAEVATIEMVPRASAAALVAGIAAARQARCEKLAQLVAQTLVSDDPTRDHGPPAVKIERATLSPGKRRDQ